MTAFIAVAAGATTPAVADEINVIFSKVKSQLAQNARVSSNRPRYPLHSRATEQRFGVP